MSRHITITVLLVLISTINSNVAFKWTLKFIRALSQAELNNTADTSDLKKQQLPVPFPLSSQCSVWCDEEDQHKHHSCQNLGKINIFRGRRRPFPQNVQED